MYQVRKYSAVSALFAISALCFGAIVIVLLLSIFPVNLNERIYLPVLALYQFVTYVIILKNGTMISFDKEIQKKNKEIYILNLLSIFFNIMMVVSAIALYALLGFKTKLQIGIFIILCVFCFYVFTLILIVILERLRYKSFVKYEKFAGVI